CAPRSSPPADKRASRPTPGWPRGSTARARCPQTPARLRDSLVLGLANSSIRRAKSAAACSHWPSRAPPSARPRPAAASSGRCSRARVYYSRTAGRSACGLNRVLLLSDGLANVGEMNPDAIADDVSRLAREGVNTTTLGVGDDYHEDLLEAMSRVGD